tara:strand:+ start:293 stop:436 length:144 start_codon:yes stop_codon:yes gene_type:complete
MGSLAYKKLVIKKDLARTIKIIKNDRKIIILLVHQLLTDWLSVLNHT